MLIFSVGGRKGCGEKALRTYHVPVWILFYRVPFQDKDFEDQNLTKFRGTVTASFWDFKLQIERTIFKVISPKKNSETRFEIKMT